MKIVLCAVFVTLALLSGVSVSASDNYTITIDNTSLSKNQELIFAETSIGPNFSEDYTVTVNNTSTDSIIISLQEITSTASSSQALLDHLNITISQDGETIATGRYLDLALKSQDILCLATETSGQFDLNVALDATLGNAGQNASFEVVFHFAGHASSTCDGFDVTKPELPDDNDDNNSNYPSPPNTGLPPTGESQTIFYAFYITISISLLSILVFLLLIILKKRNKDEDKQE